jgi:hypothetical protein
MHNKSIVPSGKRKKNKMQIDFRFVWRTLRLGLREANMKIRQHNLSAAAAGVAILLAALAFKSCQWRASARHCPHG